VKHRNSIETWNSTPVPFGSGATNYNFSSSADQAYGSNLKLISGKYVIYSGDINQDGFTDSADMTPLDNDASNYLSGYRTPDINGDGTIDSGDMTFLDNNSTLYVARIAP